MTQTHNLHILGGAFVKGKRTKGITPKMCRLCVCVVIYKPSFEPFKCLGKKGVKQDRMIGVLPV